MSEFTNKNIWVFIETDEGKAKKIMDMTNLSIS